MATEESKYLPSLAQDELIANLKVHEVIMEKDSEIYKGKKERVKSIALKDKKESSNDETSTSRSDDEEYFMTKGKSDKKRFRCGDPNHLIRECTNPSRNKEQKAFVGGSWSDSENEAEDKTNEETCLMAQSLNKVCLRIGLELDERIKDCNCSRHMTGNKILFLTYKARDGGYTWTKFLKTKSEAFEKFEILSKKIQNQLGCSVVAIRTDHGREFDNKVQLVAFCDAQGTTNNFSAPRTPQSNGVVEKKNRTLQEMPRTMLNEQSIPKKFWCNAVDTSTYILNRILIRTILGKTPYEIYRGTIKVEESLNVTFNESPSPTKLSPLVDDDVGEQEGIERKVKEDNNVEMSLLKLTSERYIAPCFVNGLKAYDGEINLAFDENLISNEYAVKLCLDYEVKKGNKVVKKDLIVSLKGELYFVKFIINPKEDDVEPGVIFGRSFTRLVNGIVVFGSGVITVYPEQDPFEDDSEKTEKNIGTSLLTGRHLTQEEAAKEVLALRISQNFALLEEVRPVLEAMAYHDKYKKVLDEIWKDKVELDGMIVKEEEEAIKKVKGETLKEKNGPGAFIFPIRLEA
ncbi:retrovirus-related pol polyprotein from transposon TNT 1-94 [Tanacetum coccineum]